MKKKLLVFLHLVAVPFVALLLAAILLSIPAIKLEVFNLLYADETLQETQTVEKEVVIEKIVYKRPEPRTVLQKTVLPLLEDRLKLDSICFMYGYIPNIKGKNNIDYSSEVLKSFPYLIISEPGEMDEKQLSVVNNIKNDVKLFGYIHIGKIYGSMPSMNVIRNRIDNISEAGWHGVFIDLYGYDFQVTRDRQNEIVDYAHSRGLRCFVNAWFVDDVFSDKIDEKYNPDGRPTSLKKGDWYLLESFLMNNSGFRSDIENSMEKYIKAAEYKQKTGVNIAVLPYKPDAVSWKEADRLIKLSYLVALLLDYDGWWFSDRLEYNDLNYGPDPGLDIGNKLIEPLHVTDKSVYEAKTDKYIIRINTHNYPDISYEVFKESIVYDD